MFESLSILNLHYLYGSPKREKYVGPQANSLWAAEDSVLSADTHLALARCQNAGTASWDFYRLARYNFRSHYKLTYICDRYFFI